MKINSLFRWKLAFAVVSFMLFFFILSYSYWTYTDYFGFFPQADPDVLLHLRRITQVVGSGGQIQVNGTDTYTYFPDQGRYTWAPLLDKICIYLAWLSYRFFPGSLNSVDQTVGWVPPIFGGILGAWFFLWLARRTGNYGLSFTVLLFLLTDDNFGFVFQFHQIDHHFLEAFFFWIWLMIAVDHCSGVTDVRFNLLAGGIMQTGLIYCWMGATLLQGIIVIHALFLIILKDDWSTRYFEFIAGTFLVSGALGLTLVDYNSGPLINIGAYSLIQPLITLILGVIFKIFESLLRKELSWKWGIGFIVGIISLSAWKFQGFFFHGISFVTSSHPFWDTVVETQPMIRLQGDYFTFNELITNLCWPKFFYPLGIFLASRKLLAGEGKIVNHMGIIIFALSLKTIRYIRWFPFFSAIWSGILVWTLVETVYGRLRVSTFRWKGLAFLFCFFPIAMTRLATGFENRRIGITNKMTAVINSMIWLKNNTPDPGGFFDDSTPAYCVLCFWDLGNAITYYARRPAIANNVQYGLNKMADIFSSTDENDAFKLCKESGLRYWLVTPAGSGEFEELVPLLKNSQYSSGRMMIAHTPDSDISIPMYEKNTIHGTLFRFLGLGRQNENGVSHFRLIYLSKMATEFRHPLVKIFEIVPGAEISGFATPNAKITCYLPIKFPLMNLERKYKKFATADEKGCFKITVAYSTSYSAGGVITGDEYRLMADANEKAWAATARVSEKDVQSGAVVTLK